METTLLADWEENAGFLWAVAWHEFGKKRNNSHVQFGHAQTTNQSHHQTILAWKRRLRPILAQYTLQGKIKWTLREASARGCTRVLTRARWHAQCLTNDMFVAFR